MLSWIPDNAMQAWEADGGTVVPVPASERMQNIRADPGIRLAESDEGVHPNIARRIKSSLAFLGGQMRKALNRAIAIVKDARARLGGAKGRRL